MITIVFFLLASTRVDVAAAQVSDPLYSVGTIGNDLVPSTVGVDAPGIVILLNQPFPTDGVLFAFSAFFRNQDYSFFQIWRPTTSSVNAFSLVASVEASSTTSGTVEQIYLVSHFVKCIGINKGDRFGIFSSNGSSPIAYTYNPANKQILTYALPNSSLINIVLPLGQMEIFQETIFPYDLSVRAFYYVDSNVSTSEVDCAKGVLIDGVGQQTTTPIAIPSGQPGQVGPTGFVGNQGMIGPVGPPGVIIGDTGSTGPNGPLGNQGSTGQIGQPGIPGIVGDVGPVGYTGPLAPGDTGSQGPPGMIGPPGILINLTATNPPQNVVSQDSSSDSLAWTSELFMIGMLIWLSIISTIVIVLLLCLFVASGFICDLHEHDRRLLRRIRNYYRRNESDPYETIRKTAGTTTSETELASTSHGQPDSVDGMEARGRVHDENSMSSLKEDSIKEYKMWYGMR